MKQSIFDIQADFCKAMGHPVRLQILHLLREDPMNVSELVQQMGLPQSMVSRQLHILRLAGIVEYERHGTEMIYKLANTKIGDVCDMVRKALIEHLHRHSQMF
jgi:ArsR family transcriptional regulator